MKEILNIYSERLATAMSVSAVVVLICSLALSKYTGSDFAWIIWVSWILSSAVTVITAALSLLFSGCELALQSFTSYGREV